MKLRKEFFDDFSSLYFKLIDQKYEIKGEGVMIKQVYQNEKGKKIPVDIVIAHKTIYVAFMKGIQKWDNYLEINALKVLYQEIKRQLRRKQLAFLFVDILPDAYTKKYFFDRYQNYSFKDEMRREMKQGIGIWLVVLVVFLCLPLIPFLGSLILIPAFSLPFCRFVIGFLKAKRTIKKGEEIEKKHESLLVH